MEKLNDLPYSLKKFIIEIYEKGKITAKTQETYSIWSFKYALQELKPFKIIQEDGEFKAGTEKVWKLTPKGIKLAKLFIQIHKLLESDESE
jgi:hypothetical protein